VFVNIKPSDSTIKQVLESYYFKIPRFQRPYSWNQDNVSDFWDDTIVGEDQDYFIGSFVVYTHGSAADVLFVVDGQQRITTITLLLAALRDSLSELEEDQLARGVHNLVERPDIDNVNQYVLQSDTPYPYLQEYIQRMGAPELQADIGAEEKALESAYGYLSGRIAALLASIQLDPRVPADNKAARKRDALLGIRNKLLRLTLILIKLDDEDDAYLIFETLNTRGKDLTVADLAKNHLTRLLRPTNRGVDVARQKWNTIQELFDEAGPDININNFLHHSWLSRRVYVPQKKLFKQIKSRVKQRNANAFLDELLTDARIYRQLLEPTAFQWPREQRQVQDAILAHNMFRVAQPLPMLISLLRAYAERHITLNQLSNALSKMENFHVHFTAVTAQRTGGGTAQMYAAAARQLFEAGDANERMRVIREFTGKLRERVPVFEEFQANFGEIVFTSSKTKQRSLVRYLLRHFDAHIRTRPDPVDYSQLTIEHIAPESAVGAWTVDDAHVGMIGNLILVTAELNDQLANRAFAEKKDILLRAGVPLDEKLTQTNEWTNAEIVDRTRFLAEVAANQIFPV
jgi:hypothetical protein